MKEMGRRCVAGRSPCVRPKTGIKLKYSMLVAQRMLSLVSIVEP